MCKCTYLFSLLPLTPFFYSSNHIFTIGWFFYLLFASFSVWMPFFTVVVVVVVIILDNSISIFRSFSPSSVSIQLFSLSPYPHCHFWIGARKFHLWFVHSGWFGISSFASYKCIYNNRTRKDCAFVRWHLSKCIHYSSGKYTKPIYIFCVFRHQIKVKTKRHHTILL